MDWSNLAQDKDMWWAVVIINPFHSTVKSALTLKHWQLARMSGSTDPQTSRLVAGMSELSPHFLCVQ